MLTLYYDALSCAPASRMALEEAGAPYRIVQIDLTSQQNRTPEYLSINPLGRVPALGRGDEILTENPAILLYIAQAHPNAQLAPTDPWRLAQVNAFNAFLSSSIHVAFAHIGRAARYANDAAAQEAMRAKAPEVLKELFDIVERRLPEAGGWLFDAFSIADIYLTNFSRAARRFSWFRDLPRTVGHLTAMQQRPSYLTVYGAD